MARGCFGQTLKSQQTNNIRKHRAHTRINTQTHSQIFKHLVCIHTHAPNPNTATSSCIVSQTIMRRSDFMVIIQGSKVKKKHPEHAVKRTDKDLPWDCYSKKPPSLCCLHLETEHFHVTGNCKISKTEIRIFYTTFQAINCVTGPSNNE